MDSKLGSSLKINKLFFLVFYYSVELTSPGLGNISLGEAEDLYF